MKRKTAVGVIYSGVPVPKKRKDPDPPKRILSFKPYFDFEEKDAKEEVSEIANALTREGFDVFTYNLQGHFERLIRVVKKRKPDVVFNLVESFYDFPLQEMMAAGLCEMLGVPYTGSPPLVLGICQRKGLSKQMLMANSISTPRFKLARDRKTSPRHGLRYPLMVKPAREDGSMGVENESVVFNHANLKKRIGYLLDEFRQPVILEEFIDGRELNVSIMGLEKPVILPISEIDFSDMPASLNPIFTYQAKWDPWHEAYHRTIPVCPAPLPKTVEQRVREIALRAFQVMGCRGYARIDIRLDRKNRPFVLEVNPNPHLSEGIGLMRSAEVHGLSFGQTLRMIVEFALGRSRII